MIQEAVPLIKYFADFQHIQYFTDYHLLKGSNKNSKLMWCTVMILCDVMLLKTLYTE